MIHDMYGNELQIGDHVCKKKQLRVVLNVTRNYEYTRLYSGL